MEPKSIFDGIQTGTIYLNYTPMYIVATSQLDGATVLDHLGSFVRKIKTGPVIQTSCVGDTFAISSHTSELKVFSLSSGLQTHSFDIGSGHTWSIALTANESALFSASSDAIVRLWDLYTGKQRLSLCGHKGYAGFVGVFGQIVVTNGEDLAVRVWNLDGIERFILCGHDKGIVQAAVNIDNSRMATGDSNGGVRLWGLDDGNCIASFKMGMKLISSLQFTPTVLIATDGEGHLLFCNPITGVTIRIIQAHGNICYNVILGSDNLLTTGKDEVLRVWKFNKEKTNINDLPIFERLLPGVKRLKGSNGFAITLTIPPIEKVGDSCIKQSFSVQVWDFERTYNS